MSKEPPGNAIQFVDNPQAQVVFVDGINGVFTNENGIVRLVFYQANTMHGEIADQSTQVNRNMIAATLVMHQDTLNRVVNVLSAARNEMGLSRS